jgi:hypothetical protein
VLSNLNVVKLVSRASGERSVTGVQTKDKRGMPAAAHRSGSRWSR